MAAATWSARAATSAVAAGVPADLRTAVGDADRAAVAAFARLTSAERGRLPGIQPGREDVILAGALIAREACAAFGLEAIRCSEADLLEGAALALAEGSLRPV